MLSWYVMLYFLPSDHLTSKSLSSNETPTKLTTHDANNKQVAHGLILRCFFKRWLKLSVDDPLPIMFSPGAISMLRYVLHTYPLIHLRPPIYYYTL